MKRPSKAERILRQELRHWQMMTRMDINSLRRTIQKTKEIADRMREARKGQTNK